MEETIFIIISLFVNKLKVFWKKMSDENVHVRYHIDKLKHKETFNTDFP